MINAKERSFYLTKSIAVILFAAVIALLSVHQASAQNGSSYESPPFTNEDDADGDLPSLNEIKSRKPSGLTGIDALVNARGVVGDLDLATQLRRDSIREAGISYGARVGLSWRTREIMRDLDKHQKALDKAFDFRELLVPAPSNLLIEPPIISESLNAFIVSNEGDTAAVSDAVYNISRQAQIVAAARNWRQYLWRKWKTDIEPPPNILLPQNSDEREIWQDAVEQGWAAGIDQAEEIFEADLNLLVADFEGMVRYRVLLAEGKVTSPNAIIEDRGVTGGGDEMRVGDRAIRISNPAQLRRSSRQWKPGIR